jgi:hypothetical protein
MSEIQRTTFIEDRLDAYEGFFDPEWKWDFMQLIKDTKLQEIGFDLVRNWEAASNARALPWVMIKCLEVANREILEQAEPLDTKKIRFITKKLLTSIESQGEPLRNMLRKKVRQAVDTLDKEATEALQRAKSQVFASQKELWESLADVEAFHSSLWSSERTCYAALYYSYEWFLKECLGIKRSESNFRIGREFQKQFREAFGDSLTSMCWTDQQVNVARLARHAFAHNGGRITEELAKQPHLFRLEGDEIQVAASITTALFHFLKERALELTKAAVEMPEFQ